ncbi:hypothetical protein BPJM79_30124 [Bacillus pumilus]
MPPIVRKTKRMFASPTQMIPLQEIVRIKRRRQVNVNER